MEPFRELEGTIAHYLDDNVDTDRIIPARFLSMVTKSGYGQLLFADVQDSSSKRQVLGAGASILVVGSNFGCGSSREHAVWAIQQAGYRAVIARRTESSPGYSDIFRQNAANCGLLLIELNEIEHSHFSQAPAGTSVRIDLESQVVAVDGKRITFEIAQGTKSALLQGLDLIGTTLIHQAELVEYEKALSAAGGR